MVMKLVRIVGLFVLQSAYLAVSSATIGSHGIPQMDPASVMSSQSGIYEYPASGINRDALRTMYSNSLPQYPTTYTSEFNLFAPDYTNPNVFRSDTSASLGQDVATWVTFAEALLVQTSNAVASLSKKVQANSNTLLFLERTDSNAKLFLNKNTSNALLYNNRTNSNAAVFANRNNSNTLLFLERTDSATKLFLARNLSNALLFTNRNNSNTNIFLARDNSNTLLYFNRVDSNALKWLDTQLQTIDHGPLDIFVTTSYYPLRFDVFLSDDHRMYVENDTVIDGRGHTVRLGSLVDGALQIAGPYKVIFQDVVFENYTDEAILADVNATIIFGRSVRLELYECQTLQRPWIFQEEAEIRGLGGRLTIDPFSISVLPHTRLTIQNLSLNGVQNNNLACAGPSSALTLKACNVCLSRDFSFTSGSLEFVEDVYLSGTNNFIYSTNVASTIDSCSQLHLQNNAFLYQPISANRNLLVFSDGTAKLSLEGTTLQTTTTGLQLTRGQIIVDNANYLINQSATSVSEGFVFGDGTSDDDIAVIVQPGASLNLLEGILDYQNTDIS